MPRTLLARIGYDTPQKLELAARRRFAEAQMLAAAEPLGALYLYGYTIEMRLKAAYYRLTAVPSGWDITQRMPGAPDAPRDRAENAIRAMLGLHRRAPVGHSLVGWAGLVIETRRFHALGQFDAPFEAALSNHAQGAAAQ